jgi:hypothetical protein
MQEFSDKTAPYQISFEAFGLEMRFCTNTEELLERVTAILPPGWSRRPRSAHAAVIGLLEEEHDLYSIYRGDHMCTHDAPGKEYALMVLESQLAAQVATDAPDIVTTHAGVVAVDGRAIVMPGVSFSGKSTLTRALVEAGAVYYSDEYAVFNEDGRVLPYARRLSYRPPEGVPVELSMDELGAVVGTEPIPVGMVIVTHYVAGGEWSPRELSPGAGVLALMEHTIPAQLRPAQCMRVLKKAVEGAVILEGERGDAAELADELLETLRAAA